MKHIGWCLDKIQIVLSKLPKTIDSPKEKDKATQILDEVEEYANTLEHFFTHPKLRHHLKIRAIFADS
ncbi:hypothetical protein GOV05_00245 [Candidatus Woesearchaeota archaeon]|nr:hypothetical protein [Candidatus Woesearchaeota archaeon]